MSSPTLDRDAIVARAFALYVRRGRQPGQELTDWYEAERQLKAEAEALAKAKSAPKSPAIVPPLAKSAAAHVPAVLSAPMSSGVLKAAAPATSSIPAPKPAAAPPPPAAPPQAHGRGKNKGRKNR